MEESLITNKRQEFIYGEFMEETNKNRQLWIEMH